MKAKQEDLVREREKQLAANLIEAQKWQSLYNDCIIDFYCRRDEKKSRLKRKREKVEAQVLSFAGDDDECKDEEIESVQVKKKKVGKDPNVDTSFLPDRDREVCSRIA